MHISYIDYPSSSGSEASSGPEASSGSEASLIHTQVEAARLLDMLVTAMQEA